MSRLVVLNLGQGNLRDGFTNVTAELGEANNPYQMKFTASLPAAPQILDLCRHWRSLYWAFYRRSDDRSYIETDDQLEIQESYITNISQVDLIELCQVLSMKMNMWLNSIEFRKIDQQLRTQLKPSEEIGFVIETNDNLLRRLPWHLWKFFDDYPLAEIALSNPEYQKTQKASGNPKKDRVKILAIFGSSKGIDIGYDRAFLQQLSTKSTKAEIEFLVEPNLEKLNEQLWQQGWDILFFAGHSHSCSEQKGFIHINPKDKISLDELKYALRQAIGRGLKLAIFNSCEGLGLARQLQDLYIPQVIVMREPIPDVVAQVFFKHFLAEFSQDKSLYVAVRSARERLQGLERDYPCATWLPIIFQNPAEPLFTWSSLGSEAITRARKNVIEFPTIDEDDISPRFPSGSVPLDSPFYIRNFTIEAQVNKEIAKPGALIRIKAPREMGKTSTLLRILDYAQSIGYHTVNLNLEQIDQNILGDLNKFLRWLCARVTRQLNLEPKLDEYWDEDIGSKVSCTLYLGSYILERLDSPVVLALDEVNELFEHPQVAKDVLPLLRSWYEETKRLPAWRKLRLIVVHSTEIYVPLQLHQSPFNVGLPIQLKGFTQEHVKQLAQCYNLDWNDGEQAKLLMDMVGGHPGLIHLAIYHLSLGDVTLDQLLESAPTSSGIYHNHLQRHCANLREQPELAIALHKVINSTEPIPLEPILAYKLSSMGLIKLDHNQATPSCQLYQRYFRLSHLVCSNTAI